MKIKQHYPRNYKKFKQAIKRIRKRSDLRLQQHRLVNGDISIQIGSYWMTYRERLLKLRSFADGRTIYDSLVFKNVPLKHPDWDRTMTFKQAWKLHQVIRRLDKHA
jgi:hypothetical protein